MTAEVGDNPGWISLPLAKREVAEERLALEQATLTVERWNRQFLRLLRALRDPRRLTPPPWRQLV